MPGFQMNASQMTSVRNDLTLLYFGCSKAPSAAGVEPDFGTLANPNGEIRFFSCFLLSNFALQLQYYTTTVVYSTRYVSRVILYKVGQCPFMNR